MVKTRLVLSVDEEKIKELKKKAIDEGKSLSDLIVNLSNYYGFHFTDNITLRSDYIGQVKAGLELYRIDIKFLESGTGRILRPLWYELWVTQEYVEDYLRTPGSLTDKDFAEFGFRFIVERYKENDRKLPKEYGAFISKKTGIKLVEKREELWRYYDILEKGK